MVGVHVREVTDMNIQTQAQAPTPEDLFPSEVMHLLGTARRVIDQHISDNGTCAECASLWPCQLARQAESALATL
jgi:hypothetical protein